MDLKGREVAVLGGAGFIGQHVSRELLKRGATVMILDSFRHGQASRESASEITQAVETDARNMPLLVRELSAFRPDLMINLATINVREAVFRPAAVCSEITALGSVPPYACAQAGIKRYVYIASSEIYGDATESALNEQSLPRPKTTYGAGKLAGEHAAAAARASLGLDTIVVRPFNAYGPGCHLEGIASELIARTILRNCRKEPILIHGSGTQTRDYTHVHDLARGIVDAAVCDALVGTGPINLASGIERSVTEIVTELAPNGMIEHGEPRPGDLTRQVGNASRAATILGWSPKIPWEIGLEETIQDVLRRS